LPTPHRPAGCWRRPRCGHGRGVRRAARGYRWLRAGPRPRRRGAPPFRTLLARRQFPPAPPARWRCATCPPGRGARPGSPRATLRPVRDRPGDGPRRPARSATRPLPLCNPLPWIVRGSPSAIASPARAHPGAAPRLPG
jgi:hypothetical protein